MHVHRTKHEIFYYSILIFSFRRETQLLRFVEICLCLDLVAYPILIKDAKVVVRLTPVWLQFDGFREIGHAIIEILLFDISSAACAIRFIIFSIELNRLG